MVHYEGRIEAELKIAKTNLATAIDSGDSTKQADAQAEVAKLASEKQTIDNWKATHPEGAAPEPKKEEPKPQPQAQPQQVSQEFGAWMKENDWFVPNTASFDLDMHQEAVLYGRKLERVYQRDGREDEIGTPQYWDDITQHMRGEFPDNFEEEQEQPKQKTPFKAKPMSGGTPATRSSGATPLNGGGGNKISLSGDERRMAHTLASSGALLSENGKRLTPGEAEVAYARQKANLAKKGA
jgi:hypothetical protein